MTRPKKRKLHRVGGGGARNPNSLANLRTGPPAPVGNRQTVRHGGYAAVARDRLETREREIFDALAADAPLRDPDGGLPRHDALAVRLLAEATCRLDSVGEYTRVFGVLDAKTGDVRPAAELEARLRREALDLARELGMTPLSRAKLGLDLVRTRDLAQEMSALAEDDDRG